MKYLAYGANMDEAIMYSRCRDAVLLDTGVMPDYRLMFKGEEPNAYATIEPWKGYSVPYVLWEISNDDLLALDRFEGYPTHYLRYWGDVEFDGKSVEVIYYAKPDELPIGQPMTHYVEVLQAAYERFGFDMNILDEALRFSNEDYQKRFKRRFKQ